MARESSWEFISFVAVVIIFSVAGEGDNQLTQTSGCVCIGQDVTFTCSIDGGGNTLYNGTAFNCPSANSASNNQILLRHSGFGTLGEPNGMCNNGAITAEGVRVDGTRYTSRLNVTVSSDIVGMNVSCIYDDASRGMEFLIGNVQIDLTSGDELSRPSNVSLVGATPNYLTFKWGSVTHSCSTLLYNITMIGPNCGTCPSIVSSTTTNCSIEPLQPDEVRVCTFHVQGVLCGNVSGPSNEINITLQVPGVPMVRIIPTYSGSERNLLSLQVAIMRSGPFSNVLDGSTYYNINYTNSMSGESCGSAVIPASLCTSSVCNHDFDISSSLCSPSTVLSVSVFASSILGDGRVSEELTFAEINNFVDVSFDAANERFICTFTNKQDTSEKTCGITLYSDCNQQQILSFAQANSTDSQVTVVLDIDGFQSDTSVYCYIAAASNETYTLNLNGSIGQTGVSPSSSTRTVVIAVGILGSVALITIILVVVVGVVITPRKGHNDSTDGASLGLIPVKNNRFMKLKVGKDCDLKEFIESQDLTFQRGAAFYEFTRAEEDINFNKDVILMDKKTSKLYTGQAACDMIGAPGEGIKKPKLKKYRVFVQSQGIGIRPLESKSLVLYEHARSRTDTNKSLESKRYRVDSNRFIKFDVTENCELQYFIENHCKLSFKPGCAFFEFIEDKEDINEKKEVLLMDKKTGDIFTGPGVLSLIEAPGRDIKRPLLDQWRVFIQSMYGARIIREGSILLYDTESRGTDTDKLELEEVEPDRLEVLVVDKTCSIGDVVKKYQLGPYNPRRFFFEFVRDREEITDDKEIILMDKDTQKLFTGLKAKEMIGAIMSKDVNKPTLEKYWVFVQNGGGDARCLNKETRLLYEKNYQF